MMREELLSLCSYELPAVNVKARQLILLLHGFAMCGEHMIRLFANFVANKFPDAHFYAPNGPHKCKQYPGKYDWLRYEDNCVPENIYKNAKDAEWLLNEFIDHKLRQHDLTDKDLMLVGFSQGTRIALHVGLRRPKACAGILGYSGALSLPDYLKNEIKSYPSVKLVHGSDDQVVDIRFVYQASACLRAVGVKVDCEEIPNLGHKINNIGINSGVRFISEIFSLPVS